ncbi:hypothetical protein FRB95_003488 [Tulasnella sp. JGI-2019a]|nr:hypothetical protein FRB95_003488 [Tulasnella sp. JGI-2019a]
MTNSTFGTSGSQAGYVAEIEEALHGTMLLGQDNHNRYGSMGAVYARLEDLSTYSRPTTLSSSSSTTLPSTLSHPLLPLYHITQYDGSNLYHPITHRCSLRSHQANEQPWATLGDVGSFIRSQESQWPGINMLDNPQFVDSVYPSGSMWQMQISSIVIEPNEKLDPERPFTSGEVETWLPRADPHHPNRVHIEIHRVQIGVKLGNEKALWVPRSKHRSHLGGTERRVHSVKRR